MCAWNVYESSVFVFVEAANCLQKNYGGIECWALLHLKQLAEDCGSALHSLDKKKNRHLIS